jgi:hypothetical protein
MRDEDARTLADSTTRRKVTLKSGVVLDGALSRADHGIYNVMPLPDVSGVVQGGLVRDIHVEDIVAIA